MRDISDGDWAEMAEFNNSLSGIIDGSNLSLTEIITVLEMISARLKQLLEVKKGT